MSQQTEPQGPTWLVVAPGTDLPAEWLERAIHVLLVALAPPEVAALVERKTRLSAGADPAFLQLVARGLSAIAIARRLGTTDRSVYRRMAALRDEFGVATNAELTAELARRGF